MRYSLLDFSFNTAKSKLTNLLYVFSTPRDLAKMDDSRTLEASLYFLDSRPVIDGNTFVMREMMIERSWEEMILFIFTSFQKCYPNRSHCIHVSTSLH